MRKLKLFSVLMCLFIGLGQMWATDVTLNSFGATTSGTAYVETEGSLTDDADNTWKVKGYRVTSDGLIIGKGGANYLKTPSFDSNISSVTVTWSGNTSYYLALQSADGTTELEAHANPTTATAYTFNVEGTYTQLRLVGRRNSGTQNAAATITSVVVTYGGSTETTVSLNHTEIPSNSLIFNTIP